MNRPLLVLAFAIALRAYPRAFRLRFGAEMRADFGLRPSWASLPPLVAAGLAERWAAVRRALGAPADMPHLYEPSHGLFWDGLRSDVRHAIRMSARAPLHTALAVLALGLGIGANTAVFTVVDDVLLRPLPYRDAGRLVMVWNDDTAGKRPKNPISPADFVDLQRDSAGVLKLEGGYSFVTSNKLTVDGQSEIVAAETVTPGLFGLLGRDPAFGGGLAGDAAGTRAVLSDGFWRRRFGGDPRVIGRTVDIDGRPFAIAGVMPADFVFPYKGMLGPTGFSASSDVDVWLPLTPSTPQLRDRSGQLLRSVRFLSAVGRLQPAATVGQANAAIASIADRLARQYPDTNRGWKASVVPLHDQVVGDVRPALLLVLGGVAFILLMACANVANLVLARSIARRQELAMRAALGASPRRLALQALTESTLLALTGGAVALLFVSWGVRALVGIAPDSLPRLHEIHPDLTVLAASMVTALVAGVLVGLAPAIVAGHADVREALQEAGRGTPGGRHRLRSALVAGEIALAVVLTVGAGLLLRSFDKLLDVDPGFRVDHLLTLEMNIPDRLTTADARRAFYGRFFERVTALPGVVSAGGTTRIPLGSTSVSTTVDVDGRPVPAGERPSVEFRRALHDYFATMGIPIVRGRGFTATDGPTAPPVAVINEAMARQVFPGEDPVGRHVRLGPAPTGSWMTIVGVVGDIRHRRLDAQPEPELYVSGVQNPPVSPFIAIRTSGDPAELADALRADARTIDPTLTLYAIRTMTEIRSDSVAERRFLLLLIGSFGALALVLASVGVYGVMSLAVSERTKELGVRLALGADAAGVLAMVVGDALRLSAAGVAIGLALALALAPLASSQLYGVRPIDPVTFAVAPAVLVAMAVLAALVPARRATRVDPMTAINSR